MIKLFICLLIFFISGCVTTPIPHESNIVLSSLLNEVQIAVDDVNDRIKNTSLPPFKKAELKLNTELIQTNSGNASYILSIKGTNTTTNSNTITLELVPNVPKEEPDKSLSPISSAHEMVKEVIEAINSMDDNKKNLKLATITVEAGLKASQTTGGGIKVELVGVSIGGEVSNSSTTGNTIKLIFGPPDKSN